MGERTLSESPDLERRIFEKIDSSIEKVTNKMEVFRSETNASVTEIKSSLAGYTAKAESLESNVAEGKRADAELEHRIRVVENWKVKYESANEVRDKRQDHNLSIQAKVVGTILSALIISATSALLTIWASGLVKTAVAAPLP